MTTVHTVKSYVKILWPSHSICAKRFFSLFFYKKLVFFQNVIVINYKGEICEPKNIALPPNYGSGLGAAVSNGGILVCGGKENQWDKNNPYRGGKVIKVHVFYEGRKKLQNLHRQYDTY